MELVYFHWFNLFCARTDSTVKVYIAQSYWDQYEINYDSLIPPRTYSCYTLQIKWVYLDGSWKMSMKIDSRSTQNENLFEFLHIIMKKERYTFFYL